MSPSAIYTGERFFPVHGKPSRKRFVSFDTEDDSRGNTLLVVFYDGESFRVFRDTEPALEMLYNLSLPKKLYLTAHNLEYDLVNLFRGRLGAVEWRFFGSRLMSAKILGTNLMCWDSLNHSYHSPLAKLGDAVGLEKLDSDLGWTKGKRLTARDVEYCTRDTEIAWRYVDMMQVIYLALGAEMRSTTPATALDYWRRGFMDEAISAVTPTTRRFFKSAYYGGRVEAFRMRHAGRIEYHDVNSLYPTVMLERYPDVNDLRAGGKHGVIEATVQVPPMYLPPLPHRSEFGKLLFPTGTVRGSWCSVELDYAVSCGVRILKVHKRIGARGFVWPFRSYVEDCYRRRSEAKSGLENTIYKLLMNSLYGKFGTDGKAQRLVDPESIPPSKRTGREFLVGDLMCVDVETEPPLYANILWAAWTTALARIRLHRGLLATARAGIPLYCDTDSIIWANPKRKKPLSVGKGLGEWKLESRITHFETKGPKCYQYTSKDGKTTKVKGVPRGSAEEFFKNRSASFRKPLRMREAARRGMIPNLWVDMRKSLQSPYDKRIILPNGDTRPHSL